MDVILCRDVQSKLFNEAWQLYQRSFPEIERRGLLKQIEIMKDARFFPSLYLDNDKKLIALCFYWHFKTFKYIEHLAVDGVCRSKGIGTNIIKIFIDDTAPVICEIEPPIDEGTIKRLKFYQRNGFANTGYKFKQLKYNRHNGDLFLDLLCNKPMTESLYNDFKTTLYNELSVYND